MKQSDLVILMLISALVCIMVLAGVKVRDAEYQFLAHNKILEVIAGQAEEAKKVLEELKELQRELKAFQDEDLVITINLKEHFEKLRNKGKRFKQIEDNARENAEGEKLVREGIDKAFDNINYLNVNLKEMEAEAMLDKSDHVSTTTEGMDRYPVSEKIKKTTEGLSKLLDELETVRDKGKEDTLNASDHVSMTAKELDESIEKTEGRLGELYTLLSYPVIDEEGLAFWENILEWEGKRTRDTTEEASKGLKVKMDNCHFVNFIEPGERERMSGVFKEATDNTDDVSIPDEEKTPEPLVDELPIITLAEQDNVPGWVSYPSYEWTSWTSWTPYCAIPHHRLVHAEGKNLCFG